jgi:hypothetical protein
LIFVPVGGSFIFDQQIAANEKNGDVGNNSLFAALPCFVETDTANSGQDVNTIRRASKLNNVVNLQEIIPLDAGLTEAKASITSINLSALSGCRATKISISPV